MKKLSLLFMVVGIAISSCFAQSPQSDPYQTLARDTRGNLINDETVSVEQ